MISASFFFRIQLSQQLVIVGQLLPHENSKAEAGQAHQDEGYWIEVDWASDFTEADHSNTLLDAHCADLEVVVHLEVVFSCRQWLFNATPKLVLRYQS